MKKLFAIALLVLTAATNAHGQGAQNVKSTFGSGAPGNSTACSKIGDEYTDISAGIQYVATAITQSATVTSCTWTANGGGVIPNVTSNPATCTTGQTFFNTVTGQFLLCTAGNTLTTAAGSPSTTIDAALYGVKMDGKLDVGCTWANGATPVAVTCPEVTYTAADTGKSCFGILSGLPKAPLGTFTQTGANTGTCSGTSTAAAAANGWFMVCTDDTNAWATVKTAFQALPKGGTVVLPMGYSCTSTGLFNWLTVLQGAGGPAPGEFGGITVEGQGSTSSQIIPMPNFDFATCTPLSSCFGGGAVSSGGTQFRNFAINGLNQTNAAGCGGGTLSAVTGQNISKFHNFVLTSWVTGCASAFTGLTINGQGSMTDGWTFVDTVGSIACSVSSTAISLFNLYCKNGSLSGGTSLSITGGLGDCVSSYGSTYGPAVAFDLVQIANGACLNSYGDNFENSNASQTFTFDMSGGTLNLFGSRAYVSGATNNSAFFFRSNTPKVFAQNSLIQGGSVQGMFNGNVTGTFTDLGGNTFASILGTNVNFLNETASANKTVVTAAKTVLSAGWGTTAAVTALSGGNAPIGFTITNSGTGQGASPTITYTFPTAYLVAPLSCTATQTGGTNATGTFTSSALSATGVTFTFSLTPTAASTEVVQVTCITT